MWDADLADFRSYLRLERSLSENTIVSYSSDLNKLKGFILTQGSIPPVEVTGQNLIDFLESQSEKGISKRTQARLISSAKAFYKFLEMEGKLKENPCELLDSPKMSRSLPDVLSVEEIEKIIESVDLSLSEGHRNRAILEVLYSCGLRVSELVNLHISDLFFEEGFIRVTGKGSKQRLVPIGEPAIKAVTLYANHSRRKFAASSKPSLKNKSEDILFLNRRGGKMSREMVFLIVKKQTAMAGIDKVISPHTFRHSFASHLVENGADLRVVQEMLGHESILTTEIYTHIDTTKWQNSILKFHPRG